MTQKALTPVAFQGIGGKKHSSDFKELPIDLWATKGKLLSFTAMFFIIDHPGHLLLIANDIPGPLKWVQVIQTKPDPPFGQSLYMLDVFVPIAIDREMRFSDISKSFMEKHKALPTFENLVSELYQSTFLIVNLDWTTTTDHPPHCLSLNQIEKLVERFDLGDLDQPLETSDAFEEAIASLPDLINLERVCSRDCATPQ